MKWRPPGGGELEDKIGFKIGGKVSQPKKNHNKHMIEKLKFGAILIATEIFTRTNNSEFSSCV